MNKSSSSPSQEKSVQSDINKMSEITVDNQNKKVEKSAKPLIRYFDMIEETTASYVLGYN